MKVEENPIVKFADSETIYEDSYPVPNQEYEHWYETADGVRHTSSDEANHSLWMQWVTMEGVERDFDGKFNIYIFPSKK